MRCVLVVVAVLAAIAGGLGIFAWSGRYNVGADNPHWRLIYDFLQMARNRSLTEHARNTRVPDLNNPQLILEGAGQYAAMCTQCYLTPGVANSEQRIGMYPWPPDLSRQRIPPRVAFRAIKHGIKMSGMPAWGMAGHDDQTIWSLVAFIEKLPDMTPAEYRVIVARAPPDKDMDKPMEPHARQRIALRRSADTLRIRSRQIQRCNGCSRCSPPEEIYLRFMRSMRILPRTPAIRLTQIDYEREMTWVLADPGVPGRADLHALAQVAADPDFERAEFALLVQRDYAGRGRGTRLLQVLMDYARTRGIRELEGRVLRENATMLDLCHRLGFKLDSPPGEPEIVRASFDFSAMR